MNAHRSRSGRVCLSVCGFSFLSSTSCFLCAPTLLVLVKYLDREKIMKDKGRAIISALLAVGLAMSSLPTSFAAILDPDDLHVIRDLVDYAPEVR